MRPVQSLTDRPTVYDDYDDEPHRPRDNPVWELCEIALTLVILSILYWFWRPH